MPSLCQRQPRAAGSLAVAARERPRHPVVSRGCCASLLQSPEHPALSQTAPGRRGWCGGVGGSTGGAEGGRGAASPTSGDSPAAALGVSQTPGTPEEPPDPIPELSGISNCAGAKHLHVTAPRVVPEGRTGERQHVATLRSAHRLRARTRTRTNGPGPGPADQDAIPVTTSQGGDTCSVLSSSFFSSSPFLSRNLCVIQPMVAFARPVCPAVGCTSWCLWPGFYP